MDKQLARPALAMPFARLMGVTISGRLVVDIGTQIFNPFLPMIAAGLGMDLVAMGRLLSLESLVGLLSPLLGSLADRVGYRSVMRWGLLVGALAFLLIGSATWRGMAALGLILQGICIASFVPTQTAYLSAQLPYDRRARGLGMQEYSWALAGIVGMFVVGQVITLSGWRTPFFGLSVGLLIMWWIYGRLPVLPGSQAADAAAQADQGWLAKGQAFFALGANSRSAYSAIMASGLNFFAIMQINLTFGAWLVDRYQVDAAQLGVVALVLGCADLVASVSVSLFTDRLGKRRSVLLGGVGAALAYLCLPWLTVTLLTAVVGLALVRGFAEFVIVSSLPLLSEQVPTQRAKVMTLTVAGTQIGATVASLSGPWLYVHVGIEGMVVVSCLGLLVGLGFAYLWVREIGAGSGEAPLAAGKNTPPSKI